MTFPRLIIGDLVAKVPVIQGGMGIGISLSGLAAAVAEQGGIGVIATAGLGVLDGDNGLGYLESSVKVLRDEIRKAKEATRGVLGVNIMVALTNFADMVKTSIAEGVDVILSGAGLPVDLPKYLKEGAKTKLVPIVSSAKAARIICKRWLTRYNMLPDAFVVEGPLAGGHLGFSPEQIDDPNYSLHKIIPEVVEAVEVFAREKGVKIPVIAAGGIYTGADILEFLRLGAAGVQMGTRFVATHECDADIDFKNAYVNAKEEDLVIIKSPVGLPGRAIRNEFTTSIEKGLKKPFKCPYHCITSCNCSDSPYCIAMALTNAKKGKLKAGFAFAGQNAYRVDRILSVKELMQSLEEEYDKAVEQAGVS
ncbi:MAG: nitronate monooxygenase family protein [Syntrophobacteraceae bacterium]|nr:nitronate monooxygenase family protein [Syntrophobacteraceae bacterium]